MPKLYHFVSLVAVMIYCSMSCLQCGSNRTSFGQRHYCRMNNECSLFSIIATVICNSEFCGSLGCTAPTSVVDKWNNFKTVTAVWYGKHKQWLQIPECLQVLEGGSSHTHRAFEDEPGVLYPSQQLSQWLFCLPLVHQGVTESGS